jgi:hypothetical protein
MSFASKLGTLVDTGTAYVVHYMGKSSTPVTIVALIYSNRSKIQEFAVKTLLIEVLQMQFKIIFWNV